MGQNDPKHLQFGKMINGKIEAIILAGGLGTRLRSVVKDVPKCMAPVGNKPFLWYLLHYLSTYNITHVVLSVGYLREVIFDWIDETKTEWPFQIDYAIEEIPLGTGGGIRLALQKCQSDNVLILNGDTFFNVDLSSFYSKHLKNNQALSIALKPMEKFERYGNVEVNERHIISAFHEKQYCAKGQINGGIYMVKKGQLNLNNLPEKFSFETEVLQPLAQKKQISGFFFNDYFIDIGIPEDYQTADHLFPQMFKSLDQLKVDKYTTLLVDRDGTINRHLIGDYVKSFDEFEFLSGTLQAFANWTKQGKRILIVTNQRGIGRGIFTEKDLLSVHQQMLEKIKEAGGNIQAIYFCTAVTDEDPNRKPNTGMFEQACHDFPSLRKTETVMIGDGNCDQQFARNCGIDFIRIY